MAINQGSAFSLTVDTNNTSKLNFANTVMLREDGRNFQNWKCLVPPYLQSSPYAWEATNGTLTPRSTGKDKENYEIGNKNARTIFIQIIHPNLFLSEFHDDAEIVGASEIWRIMKTRFQQTSGLYQEQAIAAWLAFRFNPSKTVEENIMAYKRLVYDLEESQSAIPASAICSRLATALPRDWSAFKQSWTTQPSDMKTFGALLEMIRSEIARRAIDDSIDETTAFISRVRINRRPNHIHGQRTTNFRRNQSSSRMTTTTTCWTCGRVGHRAAQCTVGTPRQPENPQRGGRNARRNTTVNFSEVFTANAGEQNSNKSDLEGPRVILDSGASHHVLFDRSLFHDLKPLSVSREVKFGNSSTLKAQGCGDAVLTIRQGEKLKQLTLTDALYVPKVNSNLVSLSQLMENGYKAAINKDGITISAGQVKIVAPCEKGLFVLRTHKDVEANCVKGNCVPRVSLRAVHEALAHIGRERVIKTLHAKGIQFIDDLTNCSACQRGKQHRQPSRSRPGNSGAKSPGFIHADTCAATEASLNGNHHFLCLTDDFSKFRAVFFVRSKDEVPESL